MNYNHNQTFSTPGTVAFTFSCRRVGNNEPRSDILEVVRAEVREAISTIYVVELVLVSDDSNLDVKTFIDTAAEFSICKMDEAGVEHERTVTGIIAEFSYLRPAPGQNQALYKALIKPELSRLESSYQNQIFGSDRALTALDAVVSEITGDSATSLATDATPTLLPSRLDLSKVNEQYPQRDYIVQYEESGLNLCERLLENWGISYIFRPGAHGETILFVDSRSGFPFIDREDVRFEPSSGMNTAGVDTIHRFEFVTKRLPHKVIIRNYNDEMPHVTIEAEAVVSPTGIGVVNRYGEHVQSPAEAEMIARIRAEEIIATGCEFRGESDCPRLAAGHVFRLNNHPREEFNQCYLIVSVTHHTVADDAQNQPFKSNDTQSDPLFGIAARGYSNSFVAVPLSQPYRPPRKTPWPKVHGLMSARVDAAGDGARAELDEEGRYTLKMPFDASGRPDGKGSRKVRMAQPYAGLNSGMHFPLLKGTDVTVACYNGDPDRPLITGAVPNAICKSPVTSSKSTSNTIRSTTGITFEMSDSQSTSNTMDSALSHQAAPRPGVPGSRKAEQPTVVRAARAAPVQDDTLRHKDDISDYSDTDADNSSWLRMYVTDSSADTGYSAYFRMGDGTESSLDESDFGNAVDVTEEEVTTNPSEDGSSWFEFAAGNRLSVTTADRTDVVGGSWTKYICGDSNEYYEDVNTTTIGSADNDATSVTTYYGSSISYNYSYAHSTTIGVSTSLLFGGSFGLNLGLSFGVSVSIISIRYHLAAVTGWLNEAIGFYDGWIGMAKSATGISVGATGISISSTAITVESELINKDSKLIKKAASLVEQYSSFASKQDMLVGMKTSGITVNSETLVQT